MDKKKHPIGSENKEIQLPEELNRRDMLKKYGAYTAPLVVSMLVPDQAYAMNNGVALSLIHI